MLVENYKIILTYILINSKSNATNMLYMYHLCFMEINIFLRKNVHFDDPGEETYL